MKATDRWSAAFILKLQSAPKLDDIKGYYSGKRDVVKYEGELRHNYRRRDDQGVLEKQIIARRREKIERKSHRHKADVEDSLLDHPTYKARTALDLFFKYRVKSEEDRVKRRGGFYGEQNEREYRGNSVDRPRRTLAVFDDRDYASERGKHRRREIEHLDDRADIKQHHAERGEHSAHRKPFGAFACVSTHILTSVSSRRSGLRRSTRSNNRHR